MQVKQRREIHLKEHLKELFFLCNDAIHESSDNIKFGPKNIVQNIL